MNHFFLSGSQVEAGSTTPIYLRLYDDHSQKSEKLRLKQKSKDNHHFQPGSIDQFHITSDKPLASISAIEISHTADKYQGWFVHCQLEIKREISLHICL